MDTLLQWLRVEAESLGIELDEADLRWIGHDVAQGKRLLSEHRVGETRATRSPYTFTPDQF